MKSLLLKILTFFLLLFLFSIRVTSQNKKSTEERLHINDSLYTIAISSNNDSLLNKTLGKYVKLHYRKNNWKLFNTYRKQHIPLTYRFKDTLGRARTFKYTAAYFNSLNTRDSAYYYTQKSFEEYNSIRDSLQAGYALVNLAIHRKNVRDYTGSKYMCLLALKYLRDKADPMDITSIYNTLAINYGELDEYKNALEYHYKGLVLRKEKLKDTILIVHSLASIGDLHITQKNYNKAIEVLNKSKPFKNQIEKDPKVEAVVLDNLTYARFKNGETKNIEESFNKALELGKKANYVKVQINVLIHLAEYYKQNNNTVNAINKATKAERLSRQDKDFNANLRASKLLSILFTGKASEKIIEKRDALRDSLEIADKKSRDSFHSVELQVEEKDQLLKEEKQSNQIKYYLIIGLIIIVLMITTAYLFSRHKRQKQDIAFQEIINKLDELQRKFFQTENKTLDENKKLAFKTMLKGKYNISDIIIEFWQYQIEGQSEAQIAEKLKTVTKEGVRKRRNKLYKRLREYYGHIDKIDKFLSVSIYSKNLLEFEERMKNNKD